MEFVLKKQPGRNISVSFVLIDWSCRESLHTLDYLNKQTIARDSYEIIWIEYYQEHLPELRQRIDRAEAARTQPPVDVYAVMGMPQSVYYHKHLMYNVGILLAHGRIVCICDSDAFMKPTFVESIVRQFETDPNVVLHYDQVRNNSRRFYPFNHPDFDDVVGVGCVNWVNGKPLGLIDRDDPLHSRNYGACMCALREDLIAVGGADMHVDYLGYICGPYDLTFRLANKGKREVWHQGEWLYHVWHPGQAGDRNYAGPHDGLHLSTTALAVRTSGRTEPLVPHQAITKLRQGIQADENVLADVVDPAWDVDWDVRQVETNRHTYPLGNVLLERREPTTVSQPAQDKNPSLQRRLGWTARMRLLPLVCGLFLRQFQVKRRAARLRLPPSGVLAAAEEPVRRFGALWGFAKRMMDYNWHLLRICWLNLLHVASLGTGEVVLYGDGDAVRIVCALAGVLKVRIRAVCPFDGSACQRRGCEIWSEQELSEYDGIVIVAAFVNSAEHVRRLEELGLSRQGLVILE